MDATDKDVREIPGSEGVVMVSVYDNLVIPSSSVGKRDGLFLGYQKGSRGLYAYFSINIDNKPGNKGIPLEEATRECKTKDGKDVAFPLKIQRSNGDLEDGWRLKAIIGTGVGPEGKMKVSRVSTQPDGSLAELSKVVTVKDLIEWNVTPGER